MMRSQHQDYTLHELPVPGAALSDLTLSQSSEFQARCNHCDYRTLRRELTTYAERDFRMHLRDEHDGPILRA